VAEVSALRDLEELRGYTQSNPLSVSQQEAIEELSNRQKAASAAGTVSPLSLLGSLGTLTSGQQPKTP